MTSNDAVVNSTVKTLASVKPVKTKNKMKGIGNREIDAEYSDEFIHKNNLQMELAKQMTSNDKTARNNTVQSLKGFNSQPLNRIGNASYL